MSCNSNGEPGTPSQPQGSGTYALVIYIPDPLGKFLDDLRRELVPHYNPHAHVSVLPPRPIDGDWHPAAEHARALAERSAPFEVELTRVGLFGSTSVIYIEVGAGAGELVRLHAASNANDLAYDEPFEYHPHITLAQEIVPERVSELCAAAERRWEEFAGSRRFLADRMHFVRNIRDNEWLDLAECNLGTLAVR